MTRTPKVAKIAIVDNGVSHDVAKAYLLVDGELVYEVAPNAVLNIGRLASNDVVLDDYKVSREHAVLKFSRAGFTLVDLASSHGSYVNGERVERSVVEFGDTIRIVSHELVLSGEMPQESLTQSGSLTMPKMVRTLDRRLKFFGGLNEFSLLTLVQFLHQEKQSGLLFLEVGQNAGPRIYFENGDITHVEHGDGLAELLVRQEHEQSLFFYFHHETNFPERSIMTSTPSYLMDLCQSHDEKQGRGKARSPATITKSLRETANVPLVW